MDKELKALGETISNSTYSINPLKLLQPATKKLKEMAYCD